MASSPLSSSRAGAPPLVSVVVIFWNEADFLAEAIESVLSQTVTDWELLLVDDGSTDGSGQIADAYRQRRPARIRCLRHPDGANRGMSASRNLGVGEAQGTYIAYLDGDDRWLPTKLERQLAIMADNPQLGAVYGPLIRWYSWTGRDADRDRDDRYGLDGDGYTVQPPVVFEPGELVALFVRHKDLIPSGALFERRLFLEVGGADEAFVDSYEDAVVWVKMGLRCSIHCAEDSWYLYRQYPDAEADRRRSTRPPGVRLRGDAARSVFLRWVNGYIDEQGIDDRRLDAAIRDATASIERPRRHRLRRLLGRIANRVRRPVSADRTAVPLPIAVEAQRGSTVR